MARQRLSVMLLCQKAKGGWNSGKSKTAIGERRFGVIEAQTKQKEDYHVEREIINVSTIVPNGHIFVHVFVVSCGCCRNQAHQV